MTFNWRERGAMLRRARERASARDRRKQSRNTLLAALGVLPLLLFDVGSSIRGGGGGVAASADTTFTGNNTFSGSNVASGRWTFGTAAGAANAVEFNETAGCITFEGSSSDTIQARLCATNPTTGDRTFNIPLVASAGTSTLVTLESPQTFSGNNTHSGNTTISGSLIINNDVNHSFGTGSALQFQYDTSNTPDTMKFGTGTASNAFHMVESADINSDLNNGACGTAACTHPTLTIFSTLLSAANYSSYSHVGSAGKAVKTLTEGAATSTVQITVAAEAGTSGVYIYTVYATDGSTPQVRSGRIIFSVTNDGGTETCVLGTAEELDNTPTGTLTATVTCSTSPTNAVDLQINATSDLTQTTLEAYSQVILSGPGQLLPQ